MARIVNSNITPIVTLCVRTIFKDGSFSDSFLKKDDIVKNLRYISDKSMINITGRISDISFKLNSTRRLYTNITKAKSYFSTDVTPVAIFVDKSTVQHSDVVEIPVNEIVENEGVTNVQRMKTWLSYGLRSIVTLTDGTTNDITIHEGDIIENFVYLNESEEPATAKVIAIEYDKMLNPTSVVTIIDGSLINIPVKKIKSIGNVIIPTTDSDNLQEVINNSKNSEIYLNSGLFTSNITFEKDITIKGAKSGIRATKKTRDVVNFKDETVLSGSLKFAANSKVNLEGIVLTKNAILSLTGVSEVTITNCIISGLTPQSSSNFVITTDNSPMKMNISGCYFGSNGNNRVSFKNTIELNSKLLNNSIFENNYFEKDCARNNDICIYSISDNATITIKNNEWEESGNGVRIGTIGDALCTINMVNNKYNATTVKEPQYAGLMLVQPYGKQTTNMSRVTININKTIHYDKLQLYYLYSGNNDMPFTKDNLPTIIVDGVKQNLTKYINTL